jgi:hypothetical protein
LGKEIRPTSVVLMVWCALYFVDKRWWLAPTAEAEPLRSEMMKDIREVVADEATALPDWVRQFLGNMGPPDLVTIGDVASIEPNVFRHIAQSTIDANRPHALVGTQIPGAAVGEMYPPHHTLSANQRAQAFRYYNRCRVRCGYRSGIDESWVDPAGEPAAATPERRKFKYSNWADVGDDTEEEVLSKEKLDEGYAAYFKKKERYPPRGLQPDFGADDDHLAEDHGERGAVRGLRAVPPRRQEALGEVEDGEDGADERRQLA